MRCYRFGFNGMEKTDEWQGAGMEYTTEYRQYDPRLDRWMSLDPLMAMFPHISPFAAYDNNPIYFVDPYGLAPGNGDGNGGIFPENPKAGQTVTDKSSGTVYTYEGITGKWIAQLNTDAYGGYVTWTVDENGAASESMYFPPTGNSSETVVSSGTYQHVESTNALFGLIENEGLQAYEISYDIILKTREYENRVESETDYRVTNIKSTWSSHSLNIGVYTVALTEAAAVRLLRAALGAYRSSTVVKPALRAAYEAEVKELATIVSQMRAAGNTSEEIARTVHALRREIGMKYKALTPGDLLQKIYQRNLQKYGDKFGPSIDYLRNIQGKSWNDIINSAIRTGGKDLGF